MIGAISIISQYLKDYLLALEFNYASETVSYIQRFLSEFVTDEFSFHVKDENQRSSSLFQKFEALQSQARLLLNRLGEIATGVGLIPFEVEDEIVYLSPDSSEGKALSRIRDSQGNTDHWDTVVEPGENVDLEEVSQWLEVNDFT